MRPFITGSRNYGKPDPDSDIDLVVWMGHFEAEELRRRADEVIQAGPTSEGGPDTMSLRFGDLNLIICLTENAYTIWKMATIHCEKLKNEKHKSVSREQAIKIHRKFRAKYLGEKEPEDV